MNDEERLAELLCARLCHDLAGPLGGASAGAELLEEEAEGNEALALLASSVGIAAGRLRYLRAAFGHGGAPGEAAALRDMVRGYFDGSATAAGRCALTWAWRGDETVDGITAKLLLNLAAMAREALPRGGTVTISGPALEVTAEGRGAMPGEAGAALAAKGADGLSPRQVQGYFAARLAQRLGKRISLAASGEQVCFTVTDLDAAPLPSH